MKRRLAFVALGATALAVVGLIAIAYSLRLPEVLRLFTSNAAKIQCTNVFVAGRDPSLAYEQDFRRLTPPGRYLALVRPEIDLEARRASASFFGLEPAVAVFREGIGCTAALGVTEAGLRAQGEGVPTTLPPPDPAALWPEGAATLAASPSAGVDRAALLAAVDAAFAEPEPERPRNTRAVVVVFRGRIIAERYAPGFGIETTHLSNSMAKSITSALVGILLGQGKLDLHSPAPIAEWRRPADPRGEITLDQLLRMSSGLRFEENYEKIWSDTTRQFVNGDLAGYAASLPLETAPGARWRYSTGTSNILGRIVREAAGPDLPTAFAFPRRALFDRIGMRTAVLEVDARGNFIGGSNFQASARDYARFGLLYLRDGTWNGERILPEGWVAYTRTPTPNGEVGLGYGAQFWLNTGGDRRRWLELPGDAYLMNGHQGQNVWIIPSRDAIIVRLGLSEFENWDLAGFPARVLQALPARSSDAPS